MKVTVIGKERIKGVSKKTGKDFDMTVVHYCYKRPGVDGTAVDTLTLNAIKFPPDRIYCDEDYNIDRDNNGYVIAFDPV